MNLELRHVGLPHFSRDTISSALANRLAATLDRVELIVAGAPLPLLWHWAFFPSDAATGDLGPDGHPRLGLEGPLSSYRWRMLAGGRIRSYGPLVTDQEATRHSVISSAEQKESRNGPLLFVTVQHEIHQRGDLVIAEEQDLVYRQRPASSSMGIGIQRPTAPPGGWCDEVSIDAVRMFRFSAVTFNSHRIHYDLPYAKEIEGYPRLVVQGPLTAIMMLQSAHHHLGRQFETRSFAFRAQSPLFQDVVFAIVGEPSASADEVRLTAVRGDGSVGFAATASMRQ